MRDNLTALPGDRYVGLKHYLDIHLFVTKIPIDWALLTSQAALLHWTAPVEYVLMKTQRLFSTTVPDEVFSQLRARRSPLENAAHFLNFQQEGGIIVSLKETLKRLSFREQLWLLGRILVPPARYMRQRYAIPDDRAVLPYYGLRWWEQMCQVGLFIWHRLRRSRG